MVTSDIFYWTLSLQWRHNRRDGVSNHQPHECLLKRLFGHRSKKTSKLRITGLGMEISPVAGEFPAQKASNVENVLIWWRHLVCLVMTSQPVWYTKIGESHFIPFRSIYYTPLKKINKSRVDKSCFFILRRKYVDNLRGIYSIYCPGTSCEINVQLLRCPWQSLQRKCILNVWKMAAILSQPQCATQLRNPQYSW